MLPIIRTPHSLVHMVIYSLVHDILFHRLTCAFAQTLDEKFILISTGNHVSFQHTLQNARLSVCNLTASVMVCWSPDLSNILFHTEMSLKGFLLGVHDEDVLSTIVQDDDNSYFTF